MSVVYSPNEEFHLKIKAGDVGRFVLLCGDPGRCEKIARYFDDPVFVGSNREYTIYTGTLEGEKISVCSTGIGGPSVWRERRKSTLPRSSRLSRIMRW